ncbi:methyltransferase domain-containing protein [soil metagenome]
MTGRENDSEFVGSVPALYEQLMVPMIFAEAADLMAGAIAQLDPQTILETAAGTGVVTRALLARCPAVQILATDLNEPMLAVAAQSVTAEGDRSRVRWQQGDAQQLDVEDASFDVVVCQFGAMFFPDRPRAWREARRVLRPGGTVALGVWDSLDTNDFARVVQDALVAAAPDEPLLFMGRTPHGLHDEQQLRAELAAAGFGSTQADWVDGVSRSTAAEAALAYCQGTPLRGMLATHGSLDPDLATRIGTDALLTAYGSGAIEGRIRWLRLLAS